MYFFFPLREMPNDHIFTRVVWNTSTIGQINYLMKMIVEIYSLRPLLHVHFNF